VVKYKQEIEARQQKQQLTVPLAKIPAKAHRAMQDASFEQSFEIGNTKSGVSASAVNNVIALPNHFLGRIWNTTMTTNDKRRMTTINYKPVDRRVL
jgi:hypothetical protein